MTNILSEKPTKKNFDFIDSIRCIAMIGIVMEHSSSFWLLKYQQPIDQWIQASYMQIFKFATISFFLISGFLINHKFTEYTPIQYLKNRFKNTIGPWFFWIIIFIILNIIQRFVVYWRSGNPDEIPTLYNLTIDQFYRIVFFSNYWFILNFLICISILLIFKKYLYSIKFGIIWLLISLFYSVNIYYAWIPPQHTTALFGFVVYLWLGVYLNKHYQTVSKFLNNVSFTLLILINVLLFIAADLETIHLMHIGSVDVYNTLRFSNILYSLTMFALLLKIGSVKWLQVNLKPRLTTFGIYLIHQILIARFLSEIFRPSKFKEIDMTALQVAGFSFIRFVIVYLVAYLLTRLILNTKFKWSIGANRTS